MIKRILTITMCILMTLSLAYMTACSKDEDGSGTPDSKETSKQISEEVEQDPALDKEIEDATIISKKASEDKFYGSWTAKSEKAEYLYGNIELKIKEDKTWSGNVTDTPLRGKWTPFENGIRIKDSDDLINWKLYYTVDNVLLFEDLEDPGNPVVLKKK